MKLPKIIKCICMCLFYGEQLQSVINEEMPEICIHKDFIARCVESTCRTHHIDLATQHARLTLYTGCGTAVISDLVMLGRCDLFSDSCVKPQ